MPTSPRTAVVAVGGNALLEGGGPATIAEQFDAARRLAPQLCRLVADGWRIVLTHGNGPQVGFIMRRSDLVADIEPGLPQLGLDMAVADSQGSLGYILGATLRGEVRAAGLDQPVVALLTHTVVDPDDPAFGAPTKPIGSFYEEADARRLADANGWAVAEDSGRGWRRLVGSPRPLRIVEQEAIETLVDSGFLVVAAGGGGIPVVETPDGRLHGVEAVIDKDFASALLATALHADLLCITTGVDRVAVNFGRPDERALDVVGVDEARRHLADGQFPAGSMGPKIEAALGFLEAGGDEVLICGPDRLADALDGATGTRVVAAAHAA
ncbi:MAG: carbamate kinase [Solirubrobacteraceae bacterium]|jgi:carbamate kinase|nr:carbamate kinase [Solirubrobacteraceae bacterium]